MTNSNNSFLNLPKPQPTGKKQTATTATAPINPQQKQNKQLLQQKNKVKSLRLIASLWLIAGFAGFLDASYLSIEHFRNLNPHCFLLKGCGIVITSKYSVIFGVPIAFLGAIYYFIIIILSFAYIDSLNPILRKIIIPLTAAGFIASVYFVYLQFFVIRALCLYCMGSATTGTILFIVSLVFIFQHLRRRENRLHEPKKA